MKSLVFSLACLLVVACGGTKKNTKQADMPASAEAASAAAPLQAIYEIREQDGDRKVGMVYKRDHGEGRSIFWVYDSKGTRRGFVTPENRAFAYEYVLDKRSDKAIFIGADTISASSRKVLGHDRAVKLVEIDIATWAESDD
ncbi:MAG: hypothetical protein ACYTEG_03500 [Planctomycetota bacterium]|jgi:hypothetical protein